MSTTILIRQLHGLGDVCQFSSVLKHLRKHRPDWIVDVLCGRGKHTALRGLCRRVYHDQEPEPKGPYDTDITLGWFENYSRYNDRPNSKITNCLAEVFGLPYDPTCGRYEIHVSDEARHRAGAYLRTCGCHEQSGIFNAVVIHYEGNTSPTKKNLAHWQAQAFCELTLRAKCVPILLDWDRRSPLPDQVKIFNPGTAPDDLWGGFGSGDAETIAALISLSTAFVGIDSGPGKVASATDTPTLICWKGHHPIQFHDPAPNTLHLVPERHSLIPPADGAPGVTEYFVRHYDFITYEGDHGLVAKVISWLSQRLNVPVELMTPLQFVLPAGIGDIVWALTKLRAIAGDRPIDVLVSGDARKEVDRRSLPFLKRFPFIRNASVADITILQDKENPTNSRGRYNYVSDGLRECYHYLIPNTTLEAGMRLEEWLPEYPTDWNVMDSFDWSGTERGDTLGKGLDPFVAFYLGPEAGNVSEGHNRGFMWEPKHWVALAKGLTERGMKIAVVGASYDRSYWERYVRDGVGENGMEWFDLIGKFEIGETFAFLKEAKCFVSYQCGLGIVSHYLGQKVVMWWRPEGESCHESKFISFDERMRYAWLNPKLTENYIGLVYKRESPEDILRMMDEKEWLK